ncbi:hypothetical protein FLL46_05050 [Aliikangiella coralliicola]|uniref:Serine aminopeptidase S33 domain-containing protein n=2 Tax=Aliikangiella coralliicola TaxID=2592383 RepID=A0A545UHG3_9GAMM|nr:hypothetical protein FLL46_05050 [Aliikangiella coralliicola]
MFGESESPLYGVYHSPLNYQANERAFLICMPLGHEYYKNYSGMRMLADELALQGHHVLRFCYKGTGDSSGDSHQFDIEQALHDIKIAQAELKELSGIDVCSVFGMRMGATLAALSAQDVQYDKLIFWDPIISGREYTESLMTIHAEVISDSNRFLETYLEKERFPEQVVGLPFSTQLRQQIDDIHLSNISSIKANSISIFCSANDQKVEDFIVQCKQNQSIAVNLQSCTSIVNWEDTTGIEKMVHPGSNIGKFVLEANK